jgi:hypothetical protein
MAWPRALAAAAATLLATAALAQGGERAAILDAIRPVAAAQAGQPVRIKVERLNRDGDWAMLVGALVTPAGTGLDWRKARQCEPELDKLLWAVLRRDAAGAWQIRQLDICAPEPPYWNLEQFGGFAWPCGLYQGLQSAEGADLAAQCRRQAGKGQRASRS